MYTKVPNHFIEVVMNTISPAATVLYLIICRKTIGWQKETDSISVSQFMELSGLTKPTVKRALSELAERGIINTEKTGRSRAFSVATSISVSKSCCQAEPVIVEIDEPVIVQPAVEIVEPVAAAPSTSWENIFPQNPDTGKKSFPSKGKNLSQQYKEKKPIKKEAPQRDERLSSWQFAVYRELTRLNVPHAFRDKVFALKDEQLWREVITRWIGRGYRPNGIQGMLDWYEKGATDARRTRRPSDGRKGENDIEQYLRNNERWTDEV